MKRDEPTFKGFGGFCECGHHAWASAGRWRITIVSPSDAWVLKQRIMFSLKTKRSRTAYVFFYGNGHKDRRYLHRFLEKSKRGVEVDHRNHDGLDNTRENLRKATKSQNGTNSRRRRGARWKYRGVRFRFKSWKAQIRIHGVNVHLGSFETEEQAARAYDVAAREHHGEFATLNFGDTQ